MSPIPRQRAVFPSMPDDDLWRSMDPESRQSLSTRWYRAQNGLDGRPDPVPRWAPEAAERQREAFRHAVALHGMVRRAARLESELAHERVVAEAGRRLARADVQRQHLSRTLLDDTEPIDMRAEVSS